MKFDVRFTRSEKIGMTGAMTVVLSAFLPWVTLGLGRVSVSGLAGGYPGHVTLALGLTAFAGVVHWGWRIKTRALLAGVGLATIAVVWFTLVYITGRANLGLGLVTTTMGATILLANGVYGLAGDYVGRHRITA
ncbi:hypothetical protein [Halostella sp. PRR32]|uniref:hypothetical protein n=1 Tax=Halostella sp. PRR32 TaxID=3098147 RepID=UPI002B1D41F9|nr:hypothetical protein [Halostella sp. PRR32]